MRRARGLWKRRNRFGRLWSGEILIYWDESEWPETVSVHL